MAIRRDKAASSSGDPGGIDFLFGRFVPRCTHEVDKRFEGYAVLQYCAGGGVRLSFDGKQSTLEGRCFWSSYPGPRIAFKPLTAGSTWVHRYLAFRGPALARWEADGIFPVPPMPAPPNTDAADGTGGGDDVWARRFDHLLELSRREDALGQRRAALELESVLCELADARAAGDQQPDWLVTAKSRLEVLGVEDVDYDRLAADLGFSPRTFRREFARRVGLPPHRYLLASRISHAREMLAHTDLPIKEISRELGYRDVFYFTRQFRRLVGVPPGVYRRSREG